MYQYLLPAGSIVLLNGGKKRIMITGVLPTQKERVYDYTGVAYPEGEFAGCMHFLFNHEDIQEIIYKGFEDEQRKVFVTLLETLAEKKQREANQEKGE